jgi:hypothetical protein
MSGLVWPGNLINFICRSYHLFYCVTLIGTMESFEFFHGYICSICVPILFIEGLCGWPTVMVQLFDVAPTLMELIKNNNLLEKFTSVFHRILKMSLNQR